MIRAALAGYGWWGRHMALRLEAHERFEVAGIYAPELEKDTVIDGHRVFGSYEALLEHAGADAVVLTSPNDLHEPQAIAAAAASLHVFCEKPLSLSGASARRIVEAVSGAGRVLAVGHERRFEPAMQKVASMVRSGTLGTIMHAEAAFSHDKLAELPADNWRTKSKLAPGAAMTGMGIHLTDFFIWMFGPVEAVQAITADRALGWETGDVVSVQLRFRAGMTATLSAILKTPHFIRFHVFGSDEWTEVRNDTHPDTPGGVAHLALSRSGKATTTETYPWTDTVMDNLSAFADAIEGRSAYPFTEQQLVHNIQLLEAIVASAVSGETVRL
ncbi:MAG: Gfo/Idh/MocA family oxidoreductase [Pseudomonadota bacterium]